MERSSFLEMFMTNLGFCIKGPMWKSLNKIVLLRENTNIYLISLVVLWIILVCASWSSIVSHVVYFINRLPSTVINHKTPYLTTSELNMNLGLENIFFLVTRMRLKDILFLILIIEKYLSTEILFFMKKIFSYKILSISDNGKYQKT